MKTIRLTQGKVALVDDEDFEELSGYRWLASKRMKKWYAVRQLRNRKFIAMHRAILGLTDSKIQGDHRNGDGLDNRRENLRSCSWPENSRNRRPNKNRKHSKFKGVGRVSGKWTAEIKTERQNIHLGRFQDEKDAAAAYDIAAKYLFRDFAFQNSTLDNTIHSIYSAHMATLVIRKIEETLLKKVRHEAVDRGISLRELVIEKLGGADGEDQESRNRGTVGLSGGAEVPEDEGRKPAGTGKRRD